ncbi:MAG: transferrin-binding protein-like solute binding protein [Neisseriaceae bacterium]|nr:transferrin-binding protein-like solute binding protein [Neisseriaceae bacterium]MBQ9724319.1 transferrin-binding protein-like solute binding protein [Neisseriaceae bacterium]
MIKNAKLLAVSTAVSVLALTACGGGGGSEINNGTQVQVNQPTKPKAEVGGNAINLKDNKLTSKKYSPSDDPEILIVDGRKFNLGSGYDTSATVLHMLNRGTADAVAYGISYNPDYKNANGINDDVYIYYQGTVTPESNIPKTGTVHYRSWTLQKRDDKLLDFTSGAFVVNYTDTGNPTNPNYSASGDYGAINSNDRFTSRASVDLVADFDKKELTGAIKDHRGITGSKRMAVDYKDTPIYAKINGNKFSGSKNNVDTEGRFFGTNADSVAGTFHDKTQKLRGSFAANRDIP